MEAGWECVPVGGLGSAVVDLDLGVGYTSVVPGFWIWLVFAISVTT